MRIQAVTVEVAPERREEYLETWFELAATLLSMNIRSDLYTEPDRPARFLELYWFDVGSEAALADDRVARLRGRLEGLCSRREGDDALLERSEPAASSGT